MATIVDQAKAQMAKSVESTKENFSGIRTGRANPALLNGITVDYYGAPTPAEGRCHHRCSGAAHLGGHSFRCVPGQRRGEGAS